MKTSISFAIAACALLGACDTADNDSAPVTGETVLESRSAALPFTIKDNEIYFSVRQDFRRCAFPMCGGWFVSQVNHDLTECPDGSLADECYVPIIDAPEGVTIEDGDLVHGDFNLENFEADYAYAPVLDDPWSGSHNLVFNTGIVCITTPCPSQALSHLNTELGLDDFGLFYLGADVEEDELLEEAFSAEYAADAGEPGGGALTMGQFWMFFGDVYYAVTNVYTLKPAIAPVCVVSTIDTNVTAWSFDNEAAAQDLISGLTGDVTVLDGRCGDQAPFCPAVYMPVSGGIDANGGACETHGNSCEFRSAVIMAAGDAKAQGTYSEGPC